MVKRKAYSAFHEAVALEAKIYIPAGVSYILDDKRKEMQDFIAVPSKEELSNLWKEFEEQIKDSSQTMVLALTEGSNWFSSTSIDSLKTRDSVYFPAEILAKNLVINKREKCGSAYVKNSLINSYMKSVQECILSKSNTFTTQILTLSILNVDMVTDEVFYSLENLPDEDLISICKILINNCEDGPQDLCRSRLDIYMCGIDFKNWCEGKVNFNNLSCGSHLIFRRIGGFDWSLYTLLCKLKVT